MKKTKFLSLALIIGMLGVLLILTGCGQEEETSRRKSKKEKDDTNNINAVENYEEGENNEDEEINSGKNEEEKEDDDGYDFSAYEEHGTFSEGLAWVTVSDYTGIRKGYINESGEFVIPLSEQYKTLRDFQYGTAVVTLKAEHSYYGNVIVINKNGEELARIDETCGSDVRYKYLNNGNIVFGYPLATGIAQDWYMYIASTSEMKQLNSEDGNVILADKCADYSEGLLYSGDSFTSMAANGSSVHFVDENGNLALYLGRSIQGKETNENYKAVLSASDFKNGKSDIIFLGQNNESYVVTIDKIGNWLTEPKEVDNDYRVRNDSSNI